MLKTVTHAEFMAELKAQDVPREHFAFKCPICGTIQSVTSLIRAGAGASIDDVRGYEGFSCVGRFTKVKHKKGDAPGKGCNYTLGGLIVLSKYEVEFNGEKHPRFQPANPDEAKALSEQNTVLGVVEGRPVFKGDALYVDIRGTCANEWGTPQIAELGANDGQGQMIIFENGDYRPADRLVWQPATDPSN